MSKKLKITLSDWSYTCGDGCCYEYGVSCKINGEETDKIPMMWLMVWRLF
jgi:hypothetical protein